MPIGVVVGADGFSAAWALDLPRCYALIPPGLDVIERMDIALLEFTAWGHHRAADCALLDDNAAEIVQTVDTGDDLRGKVRHLRHQTCDLRRAIGGIRLD